MHAPDVEPLTAYLLDGWGDDLRLVGWYTGPEKFKLHYVKDEVLGQYTEAEIKRTVRDNVMDSLAAPIHQSAYKMGRLKCTVRFFERGTAAHFILGDGVGVVVTFEPGGLHTTREFLRTCCEHIEKDA